jgi:hypothetical protein
LQSRFSGAVTQSRYQREHVASGYEGTDVLAASTKQLKGKDRVQRPAAKKSRDKTRQGHVGDALRSIYQQTVDEEVPDEFLDILGKLA